MDEWDGYMERYNYDDIVRRLSEGRSWRNIALDLGVKTGMETRYVYGVAVVNGYVDTHNPGGRRERSLFAGRLHKTLLPIRCRPNCPPKDS
jgi:hypothetical protein